MGMQGDDGRPLYKVRWGPMGINREMRDLGEVVQLREGAPNNEKILRLGYVEEIPEGSEFVNCDRCGKRFVAVGYRDLHFRKRHDPRSQPRDAAEADRQAEVEEKRLLREAPLYLEKRLAAQT